MNHPEVKLTMSANASDYQAFRRSCPIVAQTVGDLIPVYIGLVAANKSPIKIAGTIILRMQGQSPDREPSPCATMVYVSEATRGVYLSWKTMMDLGIVPPNFPSFGAAADLQ